MPDDKIKILFMSANPDDTERLELIAEYNRIDTKVLTASKRDDFELKQKHEVSAASLQAHLIRSKPQIVHFAGHGEQRSLVFEGFNGESEEIKAEYLGRLFKILNERGEISDEEKIKCVVLNACYSNSLAARISQYVDCVIGMKRSIQDDTATVFAETFYFYLCSGQSVKTSFELAKNQIDLTGLTGEEIPNLTCCEGIDPSKLFFSVKMTPMATIQQQNYPNIVTGQQGMTQAQFLSDPTINNINSCVANFKDPYLTASYINSLFRITELFDSAKTTFDFFEKSVKHKKDDDDEKIELQATVIKMQCEPLSRDIQNVFKKEILDIVPQDHWGNNWAKFENLSSKIGVQLDMTIDALDDGMENVGVIKNYFKSIKEELETIREITVEEIHTHLAE